MQKKIERQKMKSNKMNRLYGANKSITNIDLND